MVAPPWAKMTRRQEYTYALHALLICRFHISVDGAPRIHCMLRSSAGFTLVEMARDFYNREIGRLLLVSGARVLRVKVAHHHHHHHDHHHRCRHQFHHHRTVPLQLFPCSCHPTPTSATNVYFYKGIVNHLFSFCKKVAHIGPVLFFNGTAFDTALKQSGSTRLLCALLNSNNV